MITKFNITKEEYIKSSFDRAEYFIIRYKEYMRNISFISGLTPDVIKLAFGNSDFKYKGEYNCDCWGLYFNGEKFMIISADDRGTTIECQTDNEKTIKSFYTELLELFIKMNHPKIEKLKIFLK